MEEEEIRANKSWYRSRYDDVDEEGRLQGEEYGECGEDSDCIEETYLSGDEADGKRPHAEAHDANDDQGICEGDKDAECSSRQDDEVNDACHDDLHDKQMRDRSSVLQAVYPDEERVRRRSAARPGNANEEKEAQAYSKKQNTQTNKNFRCLRAMEDDSDDDDELGKRRHSTHHAATNHEEERGEEEGDSDKDIKHVNRSECDDDADSSHGDCEDTQHDRTADEEEEGQSTDHIHHHDTHAKKIHPSKESASRRKTHDDRSSDEEKSHENQGESSVGGRHVASTECGGEEQAENGAVKVQLSKEMRILYNNHVRKAQEMESMGTRVCVCVCVCACVCVCMQICMHVRT